jgi:hypothetical protein
LRLGNAFGRGKVLVPDLNANLQSLSHSGGAAQDPPVRRLARSLLFSFELLDVEIELSSLENVAVETAGLSRAGGNAGEQLVGVELVSKLLIDRALGAAMLKDSLDVAGALLGGTGFVGLFNFLLVKLNVVVLEVPLAEGGRVNLDDAVLDEGLGADKLVVGGVVDDIDNSGFLGDGL